jgi:hypothetical protein
LTFHLIFDKILTINEESPTLGEAYGLLI